MNYKREKQMHAMQLDKIELKNWKGRGKITTICSYNYNPEHSKIMN